MEPTDAVPTDVLGDREKQLIETRRAEAMALYATGHTYNARNDQLVAAGIAVIAAAAALSVKNHIDEVLLGIPVAFLLLATYAAQVDTDVRIIGVARQRLEDVLRDQLGAPALIYQSHAAQFRRGRYIRGIIGVRWVLLAGAAGAGVNGAIVAADQKSDWVLPVYLLVVAALSMCLWRAFWETGKAESDAKRCLELWPSSSCQR
jgi:hypothetical protein